MTIRDPIGRFAIEHRGDAGTDVLNDVPAATDQPTEQQQIALDKAAHLIAGISGAPVAAVHDALARFRREYLQAPADQRPVTPETFAGGFRGRNPDTRPAPQDPATVWAHFRALHDPGAFPPTDQLIASVDLGTVGPADTWSDPATGHIIEVGIIIYRQDGAEISRLTQLVRPPQTFLNEHGTGQQELHGIGPELLDGQPDWDQIRGAVGDELAGCTLLAEK